MIKKSKGFTMIELLTVIAVLGIIVLLAAPRFLSYIETAKLAQIKNDVKAHENHIESKLVISSDYIDDWEFISNQQLEELRTSAKLYDKTGLVEESETVVFTQENKIIPKKTINTKLKGIFLFDSNGKVYYYDGKVEAVERLACEDAELQGYICIYTVEDLRRISHDLSARYILMNDLDLSSIESWQPIGHETGKVLSFTGEFNGNNYSIKNLKINASELDLYGCALFSDTENAVFKNLTMSNPSININGYGAFVSPLVGRSLGGGLFENISIENSKIYGDKNGQFVASVVGMSKDSEFKNITLRDSEITGPNSFLGGIVGESVNSSYENVLIYNLNLNATENSFTGGLVGNSKSIVANNIKVLNSKIKGSSFVGGVVGFSESGTNLIKNATVEGTVKGDSLFVGGILGATGGELTVNEIKVNAEIFGGGDVGGVVGGLGSSNREDLKTALLENIDVDVSIKLSPLAASEGSELFASGGILGSINVEDESELTIKNTKSSGDIQVREYSGGIIGHVSESRGGWGQPIPAPKVIHLENVSSSINFIESIKDPESREGYFSIGGIISYIPEQGSIKLNLKNVYYDGDMGLSDFYELKENQPIESILLRKISPIVSLSHQIDYDLEIYIQKWNSLVETDNVYWIKENSPRLEQFDLLNLGR